MSGPTNVHVRPSRAPGRAVVARYTSGMRLRFGALAALACCSGTADHGEPTGTPIAKLLTAWQFVVDDDVAYVAGGNGQNGTGLVRVPLDGGATSMMFVTNTHLALAMDDSSIYLGADGVSRADKSGGALQALTDASADGVSLDDAYVYWRSQHAIARVPKDGGAEETVATTANFIVSFVVDDTDVYWSEFSLPDSGLAPSRLEGRRRARDPRGGREHHQPARD